MDNLMLNYHGCGDLVPAIPYKVLKGIQYFFYFAYTLLGVACIAWHVFGPEEKEEFMAVGVLSLIYILVVICSPYFLKFVWTLWLHMAVMMILLSLVLVHKNEKASGTLLILGVVSVAAVCVCASMGYDVCIKRQPGVNGRPPMPGNEV